MQLKPLAVPFGYRLKDEYRQGLVGHWKMNVNGGITLPDLSGNGNHGKLTNMAFPPTDTSGWAGQGLSFDGVNDYVSCGTNVVLMPDVFTVTAWVKPTAGLTNHIISWNDYRPSIYFDTANRALLTMGATNYKRFTNSPVNIVDGNWHFVSFVVTGNAQTDINNSIMYADGRLQISDYTDASGAVSTKIRCDLGRGSHYNDFMFNGSLDDIRIYKRALSASEIAHACFQQEDEWGLDGDILDDDPEYTLIPDSISLSESISSTVKIFIFG